MTKKHEGLVEELDNACRVNMTVEEFWQRAIALILSALRDGRLDEELGVVGRDRLIGWGSGAEFEHNLEIELEVGDVVIALRKQGTGKEQE